MEKIEKPERIYDGHEGEFYYADEMDAYISYLKKELEDKDSKIAYLRIAVST